MRYTRRTTAVYIIMMTMFVLVTVRLYAVMNSSAASQVLKGQYTRKLDVIQRRGFIYDRNGILLNMKKEGHICIIDPSVCDDKATLSEKLSYVSEYTQSEIYDKLLGNEPFLISTDDKVTYNGVGCYPKYTQGTLCAPHIVGYTDKSGKGIMGIERRFDGMLSGSLSGNVSYRYMSDAVGGIMNGSGATLSDHGYSDDGGIYLTLDSELQQYCEELVKKYGGSGAVCVTDTSCGDILACVSFPSFDTDNIADYLDSEKGEFVNRAFSGFTPGSVFKTVVAAAALSEDPLLYYSLLYECDGSYETEDGDIIPCHKKDGHGMIDMKTAYAQSCNPYFINLAKIAGSEAITDMAEKMGFHDDCTLDGIFAFDNRISEYDSNLSSESGYIANLAIGQGRTLVSPIGMCTVFSCAATGNYTEPGIMLNICEGDNILRDYRQSRKPKNILSDEVRAYLLEMMKECTAKGLGKDASPKSVTAAGKTATAQTGSYENGKEILNCWFCGVLPVDKPEYTVCVLYRSTENGDTAMSIFREIGDYLGENRRK
ncbi:MAG: penicillin-binding protein 2 [Ruminococcaceae bacterium]|nr:penicillin-binding protein 2 [Oscillospiraceae bacterium]